MGGGGRGVERRGGAVVITDFMNSEPSTPQATVNSMVTSNAPNLQFCKLLYN